MLIRCIACTAAFFFLAGRSALAQGEAAVPFLLIDPSATSNGMGNALVGHVTADPLASLNNPAQIGMQARKGWFSFGYDHADWLPGFSQSDLYLSTFAFTCGLNLKDLAEELPPLSIGLGTSRLFLNLGTFARTGPDGPEIIGYYSAWERSEQVTVGVGLDYGIRAAAGYTFRNVRSHLWPIGTEQEAGAGEARARLHDIGLMVDVPITDIVADLAGTSLEFMPGVSPSLNWSLGVAQNNFGQESITYIDLASSDPLPRYARAGMGFTLAVIHRDEIGAWSPVSFSWTIEASDLLVRRWGELRDSSGLLIRPAGWDYQSGLGDIRFFDEVFLGTTNPLTEKRKGWELDVLEVLTIRGGRFEEDLNHGARRYNTIGWSVHSAGLGKLLRRIGCSDEPAGVLEFLLDHVDIRYTTGDLHPDVRGHPLSGTHFSSISVALTH
jgi:hypothetical protein